MSVMGERIRQLRESHGMTQEELGEKIGVQKAAIMKYEKGNVENIKRTSIKIMSELFNVSPCYLMGLDEERLSEESSLFNQIQITFGKGATEVINAFTHLNKEGQEKALAYLQDLLDMPKYRKEG